MTATTPTTSEKRREPFASQVMPSEVIRGATEVLRECAEKIGLHGWAAEKSPESPCLEDMRSDMNIAREVHAQIMLAGYALNKLGGEDLVAFCKRSKGKAAAAAKRPPERQEALPGIGPDLILWASITLTEDLRSLCALARQFDPTTYDPSGPAVLSVLPHRLAVVLLALDSMAVLLRKHRDTEGARNPIVAQGWNEFTLVLPGIMRELDRIKEDYDVAPGPETIQTVQGLPARLLVLIAALERFDSLLVG